MRAKILKHVQDLTQQRDNNLLDASTTSSLCRLLQAKVVRLRQLYSRKAGLMSVVTAWSDGEHTQCLPDVPAESDFEPVSQFPGLLKCLEQKKAHADICEQTGLHRYWVPALVNGMPYACAEVLEDRPWSAHTRGVAEGILGVYGNYLSLLEDSQHDGLTGLANRKAFDRSLARLLSVISTQNDLQAERRKANGREHWLAIIDIDHFKRVNDRNGHLYGDEVLIIVANILRNSFRVQDRLFRFGGDEFVVLLRHATFESATHTLERFRQAVECHAFPGDVGRLTVSIGFARIQDSDTPAAVLGHADDAHYFAKENGRNLVSNYESLLQSGTLTLKATNTPVQFFESALQRTWC